MLREYVAADDLDKNSLYNLNFTDLLNPKKVYEEGRSDLVERIARIKSEMADRKINEIVERTEENAKHETIDK